LYIVEIEVNRYNWSACMYLFDAEPQYWFIVGYGGKSQSKFSQMMMGQVKLSPNKLSD